MNKPYTPKLNTTAKATAAELRAQYRISANSRRLNGLELLDVMVNAVLSLKVYNAVCGVRYALNTGRLTWQAEKALKGLTAYQMISLIAFLADSKMVQADMPRWLNEKYGA